MNPARKSVGILYIGFFLLSFVSGLGAFALFFVEGSRAFGYDQSLIVYLALQLVIALTGILVGWVLVRGSKRAPIFFTVHNVGLVIYSYMHIVYVDIDPTTQLLILVVMAVALATANWYIRR